MSLAALANVQKRVIQILNANQTAFSAAVSTSVGAFPYQEEIDLAILEADEWVCNNGYFQSANDSLATPFIVTSAPLASGGDIPFHHGTLRATEVAKTVLNLTQASVNTTTDIITSTAHGLVTGDTVTFILVSGSLPTCGSPTFAVLTNYYVIKVTADTFQLARTLSAAVSGTAIDILTASTGVYQLVAWQLGTEAKHIDDITNANQVGTTYVGAGSFNFLYKESSGSMYTPATYFRLYYPSYTRTSALQSNQAEEFLVICGAVKMLTKNASPAPFIFYSQEFDRGIAQLISDGQYTAMASEQAGGVV